jgi:hypothetical protein
VVTCWYYDDAARRCQGEVAAQFAWQGVDYCAVSGPAGLLVREAAAISMDADPTLGFGDVDEDMSAAIGDIVRTGIR